MKKTGGQSANLEYLKNQVTLINSRLEDVEHFDKIINKCDLIICCMGWTSHNEAINDPFYDLELNTKSHLYLISRLKNYPDKKVIYLGTRSQFGNQVKGTIYEDTRLDPCDVHGASKTLTEYYYKIYSKIYGFNIISLRIPACFGLNQKTEGKDIGLLGYLIKNSLENKSIEIFGNKRKRNILYIDDLTDIIFKISEQDLSGFLALNVRGIPVEIGYLARKIVDYTSMGKIVIKRLPEKIKAIDIGNAEMSDNKLKNIIGSFSYTDINLSLKKTIDYFKSTIHD